MTDTYFRSLLYRHGELQIEIDRELRAASPDWMRVLKLKKLRLSLKDRLHRLARAAAQAADSQGSRPFASPQFSSAAQG
jgi:uncharacterized protein YdcH (DUF465 family)